MGSDQAAIDVLPKQLRLRAGTEIREDAVARLNARAIVYPPDQPLRPFPRQPGLHAVSGIVLAIGVGRDKCLDMMDVSHDDAKRLPPPSAKSDARQTGDRRATRRALPVAGKKMPAPVSRFCLRVSIKSFGKTQNLRRSRRFANGSALYFEMVGAERLIHFAQGFAPIVTACRSPISARRARSVELPPSRARERLGTLSRFPHPRLVLPPE